MDTNLFCIAATIERKAHSANASLAEDLQWKRVCRPIVFENYFIENK